MHLQAGLGISSMYTMGSSEQSHAALTRGLELAEKLGDPVEQFRLIGQLHSFHRRAGNFDRMLTVARRGEAVASEMADPIGIRAAQSLLGLSHHLIGNQAEARAHLEAALAPAPASNAAAARRFGFHYERPAARIGSNSLVAGLSGTGGSTRTQDNRWIRGGRASDRSHRAPMGRLRLVPLEWRFSQRQRMHRSPRSRRPSGML